MKYKVILTTVASISVTVTADNEDAALDAAHEAADQFANQYHAGTNWSVDVNGAWDLKDSEITAQAD